MLPHLNLESDWDFFPLNAGVRCHFGEEMYFIFSKWPVYGDVTPTVTFTAPTAL